MLAYDFIILVVSSMLALVCVLVHYEVMLLTSDRLIPWALRHALGRRTVMISLMALMLGHIVEIWVYACVFMTLSYFPSFGNFVGNIDGKFTDFLYFSAVNYTSLGYGDIHTTGSIRILAVSETLAGLLMIAWSASFTYLKMEHVWQARTHKHQKREANETEL